MSASKTFAEKIRQTLADDILQGVYPPGARLDEMSLARRFNLSRTPVREALRQLISTGLVEMRPHRGAIVSLPGRTALAEMFEVMEEMEATCARLAAQRISPAERARLETIHRESAEAVEADDRESYRKLNFNFHDAIYRAAHNEFMLSTALAIRSRIAPFRRAQFDIRGRLSKSYDEHGAIMRSIIEGDGEIASEAMRAHVGVVRAASYDYIHGLELNEEKMPQARPI
ncbi:MAG TPA: GntR family transcriptional regulator [Xanthobacteraceae bacterium]|nr:GntR family transcriptional regulator [Xanthobacteraceae bacterium]